MQETQASGLKGSLGVASRITSYNVCYTKLLRHYPFWPTLYEELSTAAKALSLGLNGHPLMPPERSLIESGETHEQTCRHHRRRSQRPGAA